MATADQEDGAPHRGEREAEGGSQTDGEECLEGPVQKGSN